jgi:hypothetical protein
MERGHWEIVILIILSITGIFFWGFSFSLITRIGKQPEYTYHSLHAIEHPAVTFDLSARSFATPVLPMRLASAWEIQDTLKLPIGALASAYAMVYPLVERATDMGGAFQYKNAILASQTQVYCPTRGETLAAWQLRTGQTESKDIQVLYDTNNKFNVNSEHADVCRESRAAPMVLAHVAAKTFTLFSEQNSTIVLMYAAIVNAIFLSMIVIDRWRGYIFARQLNYATKMIWASWFAILFFVCSLLLLVPLLADYVNRNDGVVLTDTTQGGNRAVGSYVLGIWTIIFSFIYVYIMPAMNVVLRGVEEHEEEKAGMVQIMEDIDKELLSAFCRRHPMTALAYWNLLLSPCLVMVVLTSNAYGVDVYMQFIMLGTVAIGVLDVLHARVNMITRLVQRINRYQKKDGDSTVGHINDYFDVFVFIVFLCMKVVIAAPVIVKMQQANMDGWGLAVVALAFTNQLILSLIELVGAKIRGNERTPHDYTQIDSKQLDPGQDRGENRLALFDLCLVIQTIGALVMFGFTCLTRRISA